MHEGRGPQIAPDAMAVPAYAETDAARELTIGAYVGIPIVNPDQGLFGTRCGLDPAFHGDELERHAPLLQMLGSLLSMVLAADLARTELERERECAREEATTEALGRIHATLATAGVSGSIGHAPYTIVAGFPGAFAEADAAMYEQKRTRRGTPGRRPPTPPAAST